MSVQKGLTTVIRSVPTIRAPSLALASLASDYLLTAGVALVNRSITHSVLIVGAVLVTAVQSI